MIGNGSVSQPSQPSSEQQARFRTYVLTLVDGTFIFDQQLKIVTLLSLPQGGDPQSIREQQRFSDQEFDILVTLFDLYPDYSPLAELLASQSSRPLTQCQREVSRVLDEGYIDDIIRPVRNLLHRARVKLRRFGLDVRSIQETGYLLVADRNGFAHR
jgi:hypothetical protein